MKYVYASAILVMCLAVIYRFVVKKDNNFLLLAATSLFSIGYYVLPMIFQEEAGLGQIASDLVDEIMLLVATYHAALVFGVILGNKTFTSIFKVRSVHFSVFDRIQNISPVVLMLVGYLIWIFYFGLGAITSYQSEDSVAYFLEADSARAYISILGQLATVLYCYGMVRAIGGNIRVQKILGLLGFGSIIFALLSTGQRLAVIGPIFVLIPILFLIGQRRVAYQAAIIGIAGLLILSPLLVYVREYRPTGVGRDVKSAISEYKYSESEIGLIESIMNRADAIKVSVDLKAYIDNTGYASGDYYISIVQAFVPRIILGTKMHALSDDGTIWGDLSVVAWRLSRSSDDSLGSLTAHGNIVSYREGGWGWVIVAGTLTGISYAFIFFFLGRGGVFGKLMFSYLFLTIAIKSVPPGFFQLWVGLISQLYLFLIFYFFDRFILKFSRR